MQLHRCGLVAVLSLGACAADTPDEGTEAAAALANPTIARRDRFAVGSVAKVLRWNGFAWIQEH